MQCAAHDWNSVKHASSVEGVAVAVAVASVSASSARTTIMIAMQRRMACVPREFRSVNGGRSLQIALTIGRFSQVKLPEMHVNSVRNDANSRQPRARKTFEGFTHTRPPPRAQKL